MGKYILIITLSAMYSDGSEQIKTIEFSSHNNCIKAGEAWTKTNTSSFGPMGTYVCVRK